MVGCARQHRQSNEERVFDKEILSRTRHLKAAAFVTSLELLFIIKGESMDLKLIRVGLGTSR